MQFTSHNEDISGKEEISPPAINLPKGGGAIKGIGEKFAVNPVTGTASFSVPIFTSPSRSDFHPKLSLSYDSGAGNGPFGLGWILSVPSISRKTDKGLPRYNDAEESDIFILSGAEDLVPALKYNRYNQEAGEWERDIFPAKLGADRKAYSPDDSEAPGELHEVQRYRPRVEGLFARIERWTNQATGEVHWRSVSRDNITSLYGLTAKARISDPKDPSRVFQWLLEETFDDKGNVIVYDYQQENEQNVDPAALHENNRLSNGSSFPQQYLKSIKYGNRTPFQRGGWLFLVLFDYGEHGAETLPDPGGFPQGIWEADLPTEEPERQWPCRADAFSSYRAGFEIRTYRLCRRVLMFHIFPELGNTPCLVRSTDFHYHPSPLMTYLAAVTQTGYVRESDGQPYFRKSLPPLEFTYTEFAVKDEIQPIDPDSLENLPIGLDGFRYQWVDLDGEGLAGILTEQGNSWFYKRNLGNGKLAPQQMVALKPSIGPLQSAQVQVVDLAGDGRKDLLILTEALSGFFERTPGKYWDTFVPFSSTPHLNWQDPNLRLIDLTGDGHADVLITEDQVFTWYLSQAEAGFASAAAVRKVLDEEHGPALVFADATQSIYLADMCGDGLNDLVRIRNGEVCYWPNLGYGRFGAKVTMDQAPFFDPPDLFEQARIRLSDIDGTGTTDIIYLGAAEVRFWSNQSGNSFSDAHHLKSLPPLDNLTSLTVADLMGNGTACLVWSSPLPAAQDQPMWYLDLMGGQKPHLLKSVRNNLGAETVLQYASSTKFYLEDRENGKPWITRVPFPVQVLERVETHDRISRNFFVSHYAYHHGYFDGEEREFRGFGMVEHWDTEEFEALRDRKDSPPRENIAESSHVPPVYTKTWFHTGVYLGRDRIANFFAGLRDSRDVGEYFREPGLEYEQARALLLPDTVLPDDLTAEEEREACRALKGSILRQEIFAQDRTVKEKYPYSVSERNYTLKRQQPRGHNQHAVFLAHPRETIDYHYERNPATRVSRTR